MDNKDDKDSIKRIKIVVDNPRDPHQIDEKRDKDDVDNPRDSHQIDEKYDKDDVGKPRNAHNGNQVSSVSLSPNGTYVVTYSRDDKSIEGWIVKDSKLILDPEASIYKLPQSGYIREIKVNDNKIVCFVYKIFKHEYRVKIFRMSNENQPIKLNPSPKRLLLKNINFKW